jgi:hypothetical protein
MQDRELALAIYRGQVSLILSAARDAFQHVCPDEMNDRQRQILELLSEEYDSVKEATS